MLSYFPGTNTTLDGVQIKKKKIILKCASSDQQLVYDM